MNPAVKLLAILHLTVSNPGSITRLKNLQFAGGQMQQVIVPTSSKKTWNLIVVTALTMVVIFLAAIAVRAWRWPFSRKAVLQELEDASQSRVDVVAFHGTYFPRPGCVLEHITFQHNPKAGSPPLITAKRLRIEGSFSGLFRKRVRRVRAEGMRVQIPPRGSDAHFETPKRSPVMIDDLIADGAILEVASREPDKQPLKFSFHNFVLSDVGSNGPASFQARLSNPEPPGEITTSGKFGPWNEDAHPINLDWASEQVTIRQSGKTNHD